MSLSRVEDLEKMASWVMSNQDQDQGRRGEGRRERETNISVGELFPFAFLFPYFITPFSLLFPHLGAECSRHPSPAK